MTIHNDVWTINNYDVYGSYEFRIKVFTRLNSGQHIRRTLETFNGSIAAGFDGEFKQRMMKHNLSVNEYLKLYLNDWLIAVRTDEAKDVPAGLTNV